jgi:hypothetical protein
MHKRNVLMGCRIRCLVGLQVRAVPLEVSKVLLGLCLCTTIHWLHSIGVPYLNTPWQQTTPPWSLISNLADETQVECLAKSASSFIGPQISYVR